MASKILDMIDKSLKETELRAVVAKNDIADFRLALEALVQMSLNTVPSKPYTLDSDPPI